MTKLPKELWYNSLKHSATDNGRFRLTPHNIELSSISMQEMNPGYEKQIKKAEQRLYKEVEP